MAMAVREMYEYGGFWSHCSRDGRGILLLINYKLLIKFFTKFLFFSLQLFSIFSHNIHKNLDNNFFFLVVSLLSSNAQIKLLSSSSFFSSQLLLLHLCIDRHLRTKTVRTVQRWNKKWLAVNEYLLFHTKSGENCLLCTHIDRKEKITSFFRGFCYVLVRCACVSWLLASGGRGIAFRIQSLKRESSCWKFSINGREREWEQRWPRKKLLGSFCKQPREGEKLTIVSLIMKNSWQ